jgi:transcriptional regulator with XRE-family HTH domain
MLPPTGIHERIGHVLAMRGISVNAFAKMLAAIYGDDAPKRQALADYISGKTSPTAESILAIACGLSVSPEWLLTGSRSPESLERPAVEATQTDNGFGNRLLCAMDVRGMSARSLSSALDQDSPDAVSRTTISAYIAGSRQPTLGTVRLLADALNVDAGWLVRGDIDV